MPWLLRPRQQPLSVRLLPRHGPLAIGSTWTGAQVMEFAENNKGVDAQLDTI